MLRYDNNSQISGDYMLAVVVADPGDGHIYAAQPLYDFIYGRKSIEILNLYTGQKLFDILCDDLGIIHFEENHFALKYIITENIQASAMRLLGKIAEAVIVRRCHEDAEINRKWFSLARRKKAQNGTAENHIAIGTGLQETKKLFPYVYNPSDPQRDIIWRNKVNNKIALMGGSAVNDGIYAGLQVKVSRNGAAYFLNDFLLQKYEVPIVYFDICNDFDYLVQNIYAYNNKINQSTIRVGEDLISARAIDYEGFSEVCYYEDLVIALLNNQLTVDQLIQNAQNAPRDTLKKAILSSTLESLNIRTDIF